MPRFSVKGISDQEAFEQRVKEIRIMKMSGRDERIVTISEEGCRIIYRLSDVPQHMERVLKGKKDTVGELEIKYAKEKIAYAKCMRSKT